MKCLIQNEPFVMGATGSAGAELPVTFDVGKARKLEFGIL